MLHLDLDERELVIVRVDDIVLHASLPEVGRPYFQLGIPDAVGLDEPELAVGQGDNNVVVFVSVPACRCPWREVPSGHAHALVVDEHRRIGSHSHECRPALSGEVAPRHSALTYPDRKGLASPVCSSKVCRSTQPVSLASRWIDTEVTLEVVRTR